MPPGLKDSRVGVEKAIIPRRSDRDGTGSDRTLEAKRRELRDSETFSSRGEMFTNMSLWRERGPSPSISGWAEPGPGLHGVASPTLTPMLWFPAHPFPSHLSAAAQRVLQQVGQLAVPVRHVGLLEGWGGQVVRTGLGSAWLAPTSPWGPPAPTPITTLLLKAMMTSPSVDRLLLMACVSRRRSRSPGPRAKPGSSRSLPARSTRLRGAAHCRPRPACSPEICSWNTL